MTSEPLEYIQPSEEEARRQQFLREHSPVDAVSYYLKKERELLSGQMTWMVESLHDLYDRVHGLVYKGEYVGRIEQHGMDLIGVFHTRTSEVRRQHVGSDEFFNLVDALEAHAKDLYGEEAA